MKLLKITSIISAGAMLLAAPIFAQNEGQGRGQAVVTVLPVHDDQALASLSSQDLKIKVNGKESTVTNFTPLRGENSPVELVVVMDSGARTSLGTQMSEIQNFVKSMPPNIKVTLGYMENGITRLAGPLSTDHEAVLKGLHIPAGFPGQDASPYFCLSNLVSHWPSNDSSARREVVMISDGIDNYNPRYDPQDPYMEAAIRDSVRNGVVIYSIYWENRGRFSRTMWGNAAGQNLLMQVTQATGGNSYWQGLGNPVSFQPFFRDIERRLQNQYEVGFTAPVKAGEIANLKVKVNGVAGKVDAPGEVYVGRGM
ncbi:hypothetical protein DYQ86_23550 [Acidobacteria bacterium AB60]|nr:hypothetical protein DYQ86_23550 [Acidobacteria bacterium AB60]